MMSIQSDVQRVADVVTPHADKLGKVIDDYVLSDDHAHWRFSDEWETAMAVDLNLAIDQQVVLACDWEVFGAYLRIKMSEKAQAELSAALQPAAVQASKAVATLLAGMPAGGRA